jgi:TRAP transporter TAXI family solute receptor
LCLVAWLVPAVLAAQEVEINLVAGNANGTDVEIGRNIAAVAQECGLSLNVRPSAGSMENASAVRDRPRTQFGFVQGDVLEYLETFAPEDPALRRIADRLRVVFPLYDAEVHVLARRDVPDLAALSGTRVSVGLEDSGTFVTAGVVLDLAAVHPAARISDLDPEAALEALLAGEIDAMFEVSAAPANLFRDPRIDPERFHLLSLDEPVLAAVYAPARIAAGSYPVVDADLDVVAVGTVLMTFDFRPPVNSYHRASCTAIADFAHLILSRLEVLKAEGHPKWRAIDLTAIPQGWQISDCVLAGLDPDHELTCPAVAAPSPQPDAGADTSAAGPNATFLRRICAATGC